MLYNHLELQDKNQSLNVSTDLTLISLFTIPSVQNFFLQEISFLCFQFLFTLPSGKSRNLQPLWEHVPTISRPAPRKEQGRPIPGWPGTQGVLSARASMGGFTNWPSCAEQLPPKPASRRVKYLKGRETANYLCLCMENNLISYEIQNNIYILKYKVITTSFGKIRV